MDDPQTDLAAVLNRDWPLLDVRGGKQRDISRKQAGGNVSSRTVGFLVREMDGKRLRCLAADSGHLDRINGARRLDRTAGIAARFEHRLRNALGARHRQRRYDRRWQDPLHGQTALSLFKMSKHRVIAGEQPYPVVNPIACLP